MDRLMERRGAFKLTRKLITDSPDMVMKIMGNVIVVRAEHLFMIDAVEYQAYSPLFRIVPEGAETPTYTFAYEGKTLLAFEE